MSSSLQVTYLHLFTRDVDEARRIANVTLVKLSSRIDGPGTQLAFAMLKLGDTRRGAAILDSNLVEFKKQCTANPEDAHNPLMVATIYAINNNADEERGCVSPLVWDIPNTGGCRSIRRSTTSGIIPASAM